MPVPDFKSFFKPLLDLAADGSLFERFQYRYKVPPCDERGLFVVPTWNSEAVALYLNGKPVEYITSLGHGASA